MSRADPKLWSLILDMIGALGQSNFVKSAPKVDAFGEEILGTETLFARKFNTAQNGCRMPCMADMFSPSIFFDWKMPPNEFPMMPLVTNWNTFLYSIIAPKWMQSMTDMFSELKPVCLEAEMHPKWVPCGEDCLSSQCWIPFNVETTCPPNRCFLCQSCFLTLFCLTSCPQHGCFLCERCCQLRFSFWYNAPAINFFSDAFNVTPFFG